MYVGRRSRSCRSCSFPDRGCLEQQEVFEARVQGIGTCVDHAKLDVVEQVTDVITASGQSPQFQKAIPAVGVERVIERTILGDGMCLGTVETDVVQRTQVFT